MFVVRPTPHRRRRESGQAAVESALVLPLTVFMILGTLQLFLVLQARMVTEHAIMRSVRAGSVHFGSCTAMRDAAIVSLLPSIGAFLNPVMPGGTPGAKFANAYQMRANNRYVPRYDGGHDQKIIWLWRLSPLRNQLDPTEDDFDDPEGGGYTLEGRLTYFYAMHIPFANWVMSKMFLAHWGMQPYRFQNPLLETQRANWQREANADPIPVGLTVANEMLRRSTASPPQYVMPLTASFAMRMMTPPRARWFTSTVCEGP